LLLKSVFLNAAVAMAILNFDFTFAYCIIYQATQIVVICRIPQLCVTVLTLVAVDSHYPSFFPPMLQECNDVAYSSRIFAVAAGKKAQWRS
jgi:hypothetical protein